MISQTSSSMCCFFTPNQNVLWKLLMDRGIIAKKQKEPPTCQDQRFQNMVKAERLAKPKADIHYFGVQERGHLEASRHHRAGKQPLRLDTLTSKGDRLHPA